MATAHRKRAILGIKKNNVVDVLARAKGICNGIASHPAIFINPSPSIATIQGRIDAADVAQQAAATRAKGAAAFRDVKVDELVSTLESSRTYVQETADAAPDQAVAIIEAAGMIVFQPGGYAKPVLKAVQQKASGPVALVANVGALTAGAAGKVFFNWQSSPDGGKTWSDLPSTPNGNTQVDGLNPLSTYGFRVGVTDTEGQGPYSQTVTLFIH